MTLDDIKSFPRFSTPNNPLGADFTNHDKKIDDSIRLVCMVAHLTRA